MYLLFSLSHQFNIAFYLTKYFVHAEIAGLFNTALSIGKYQYCRGCENLQLACDFRDFLDFGKRCANMGITGCPIFYFALYTAARCAGTAGDFQYGQTILLNIGFQFFDCMQLLQIITSLPFITYWLLSFDSALFCFQVLYHILIFPEVVLPFLLCNHAVVNGFHRAVPDTRHTVRAVVAPYRLFVYNRNVV